MYVVKILTRKNLIRIDFQRQLNKVKLDCTDLYAYAIQCQPKKKTKAVDRNKNVTRVVRSSF